MSDYLPWNSCYLHNNQDHAYYSCCRVNAPSSQLNNDRVQPEQSSKKEPSSRDYVRSGERSRQLNPVRQPKASTGQEKAKDFSAYEVFFLLSSQGLHATSTRLH